MEQAKNIFVSHYHADADKIKSLKEILAKHGMIMRDSSIYENKNPNNAHNEEYIKSFIRPQIDWAGTMIVLIGTRTSQSDYVNWEIKHAASNGKRIIGVYLYGKKDENIPEALKQYGDALCGWNGEKIIECINGDDSWDGPQRKWFTGRSNC